MYGGVFLETGFDVYCDDDTIGSPRSQGSSQEDRCHGHSKQPPPNNVFAWLVKPSSRVLGLEQDANLFLLPDLTRTCFSCAHPSPLRPPPPLPGMPVVHPFQRRYHTILKHRTVRIPHVRPRRCPCHASCASEHTSEWHFSFDDFSLPCGPGGMGGVWYPLLPRPTDRLGGLLLFRGCGGIGTSCISCAF